MNLINLEQDSRSEAQRNRVTWNSGLYNFLVSRTQVKYGHKVTNNRRSKLESQCCVKFPIIRDDLLKELYSFACLKYQRNCHIDYQSSSGFLKTRSEREFLQTLKAVINAVPKFKHLEVYPSEEFSKDLPANFKMVVGPYVPDFLVFGLKSLGSSAVAFEVDGNSHIGKWAKDDLRNKHMEELKIFTVEIPNEQSRDVEYLSKVLLDLFRVRNGSFNQQILRAKRLLWAKTVACHLSLTEIELISENQFGIRLNLSVEAKALMNCTDCPRKIARELASLPL